MPRSGGLTSGCWTGVIHVDVLSPGVSSVGPTTAVLLTDVAAYGLASVAVNEMLVVAPAASVPGKVQLIAPPAAQLKAPAVSWPRVRPAGSVSVTVKPVTAIGPVLVMANVYGSVAPGRTAAEGPVLTIPRS